MKLTSLTIYNMFSYYDTNTIQFDNITCVIGTNGFGKTSILNSIKLCLGTSKIDLESVLNNNADEKKCYVILNFDEFSIKRTWEFKDEIEESLSITFENEPKLEDVEAEHFLQNKIPDFLVDFLFYDGEVGDNLLLLSNTRLKSIFDFIFDLDLLENTRKDALAVSKKLLENNTDEDTGDLIKLENEKSTLQTNLEKDKEELILKEKELKALAMELQKTNTQIRSKSTKTKKLQKELEEIQFLLEEKAKLFKELILWQMPLLLNAKLHKKVQEKTSSALSIEDEALFTNKFSKFANQIDTPLDENTLLELFKSMMLNSTDKIELTSSTEEFKTLVDEMKELKTALKDKNEEIAKIEASLMEQEIVKKLINQRDNYQSDIECIEQYISDLRASIENLSSSIKEIDKTLTQTFKTNQNKYAFIKGYEELRSIAEVSQKVYFKRLEKSLKVFNEKLKDNTSNFLRQYEHIEDISIDKNYNIIISDGKEKLNTSLLSAGQKQILNFLIVKTILEFKKFASFVMVDTPFGRLSNKNKDLVLNRCYLDFDTVILLLTDSEYDFIKTQSLNYKHYEIERTLIGSSIKEIR